MVLYNCEYPNCSNTAKIRTTIKEGEYKGLRVCNYHAKILKPPKKQSEQSKRTQKKRQEQRKDYPKFYQDMIELCIGKKCAECGSRLEGNVSEIAHIFKKTSDGGNPELATDPLNIIMLCTDCHTKYDSNLSNRSTMGKAMTLSIERYKLLKPKLINTTSETRFFEEYLTKL